MKRFSHATASSLLAIAVLLWWMVIEARKIGHDIDRMADTADAQLCIVALRAGIEARDLPSLCGAMAGTDQS